MDLLRRTTLLVRDAEAAARFHEHVWGWTRFLDRPFVLSGKHLPAGAAGEETRLIILRAEDPHIGMLGLLELPNGPEGLPTAPPTRIAWPMPIFVVQARDCRATVERARTAGARIHAEPEGWETEGADGQTLRMVGASLWDPEGYFFEVNERLGAPQP